MPVTVVFLASVMANTKPKRPAGADETTLEHQSKIEWLKDNIEPADKVAELMAVTADYRREWIKNRERTVAEIFQEYPRLMNSNMVSLFQLLLLN